jgi:hypothetical protein
MEFDFDRDIKVNLGAHRRSFGWKKKTLLDWTRFYESKIDSGTGMLGPIIAQSAPHVLRLAMLYAALDASTMIEPVHHNGWPSPDPYRRSPARALLPAGQR